MQIREKIRHRQMCLWIFLVESLNRAIEANSYGDETTLEVHVTADKDGAYGIEESEMETLEATMFPGE